MATERLFSSDLLVNGDKDEEWLNSVSMENKFLRETALLIPELAGPSAAYRNLARRLNGQSTSTPVSMRNVPDTFISSLQRLFNSLSFGFGTSLTLITVMQ